MNEDDKLLERAKLIQLAENTPADEATLRRIFPDDVVDEALKWRGRQIASKLASRPLPR